MPIRILPPQLANQIAAGEVVERPVEVLVIVHFHPEQFPGALVLMTMGHRGMQVLTRTDRRFPGDRIDLRVHQAGAAFVAELQIDTHLSRGIERDRFKRAVTAALLIASQARSCAGALQAVVVYMALPSLR